MIPRFRVFDKVENLMIYTYEDVKYDYGTGSFNCRDNILYETEHYPVSYLSMFFMFLEQMKDTDQLILMQSTGLFDKNGKEIFEGDIVENTTQMVYLGHRFEVSWNGGYACFQLLNGGKSSNVPLIQDFMSYEVVGNIHENPELVGVKE